LYLGGAETTSKGIAWALLFMLHNPQVGKDL